MFLVIVQKQRQYVTVTQGSEFQNIGPALYYRRLILWHTLYTILGCTCAAIW